MGRIDEILMGKSQIDGLNDIREETLKEIEKIEKIENQKKKNKLEEKLRKKLERFFNRLYKLGVEVYLDKKSGGNMIKNKKDFENIGLKEIYDKYVMKTLEEINKEITRRIKEDDN